MKKTTKLLLALFAFALIMSGCEDDVTTSELIIDFSKKGAIEVHLFADLDKQQLGKQIVPDGTKVLFLVEYSEFNPEALAGSWTMVGESSNGIIRIDSLPTTSDGVEMVITPEPFVHDQTQAYESPSPTLPKLFHANPIVETIIPDLKVFRQIEYDYVDFGDPAITVNRKWQGRGVFNLITNELSDLPSGTQITMFNDSWATTLSAGSGGSFTADVPYGEGFTIMFTALMTLEDQDGNPVQKTFRYTANRGPYFENSPVTEVVDFSHEIWE